MYSIAIIENSPADLNNDRDPDESAGVIAFEVVLARAVMPGGEAERDEEPES